MRGRVIFYVAVFLAFSVNQSPADCSGIPDDLLMKDGNWLYRTGEVWKPISTLTGRNLRGRSVVFSYVAVGKKPRYGALVVKTGVLSRISPVDNARKRSVYISRQGRLKKVRECESYPPFSPKLIDGDDYDRFHDRGISGRSDPILKKFHVRYASSDGSCRGTADTENRSAGHFKSNLSQFSFDDKIVSSGQPSQIIGSVKNILAPPANAAESTTFVSRSVEIKRYVPDSEGRSCIMFERSIKPGSVILLNDLERANGRRRSPELRWVWRL